MEAVIGEKNLTKNNSVCGSYQNTGNGMEALDDF